MNFYNIEDEINYNFYMMPKQLFNEEYKQLTAEAKLIYMLILDRLKISKLNTWINEEGELYLLYSRAELSKEMGICEKTVIKILNELKDYNLIKEKRQGLGKPNKIFVYKIDEDNKCQNENCNIYNSKTENNSIKELEKNTVQELENLQCNNNKYNNNNNFNNNSVSQYEEIEELEEIKAKCELDYLTMTEEHRMKPIFENLLEIMYFSKNLKINNAILPQEIIREKMKKLNSGIILYTISKLNKLGQSEQGDIKNSTNFLITCLYNCITEYYLDSEIMFKREYG